VLTGAAVLVPLLGAGPANAAPPETLYGPFPDQATCNYWRGGVDPGGASSSPCFVNPATGKWFFYDY
jgi:hypothetical protein